MFPDNHLWLHGATRRFDFKVEGLTHHELLLLNLERWVCSMKKFQQDAIGYLVFTVVSIVNGVANNRHPFGYQSTRQNTAQDGTPVSINHDSSTGHLQAGQVVDLVDLMLNFVPFVEGSSHRTWFR